eukprot:gene4333-5423_t
MHTSNKNRDLNEIDLHGLFKDYAIQYLEERIETIHNMIRDDELDTPIELYVITGMGNNSGEKGPVLKPAVEQYLIDHDYEYNEISKGGAFQKIMKQLVIYLESSMLNYHLFSCSTLLIVESALRIVNFRSIEPCENNPKVENATGFSVVYQDCMYIESQNTAFLTNITEYNTIDIIAFPGSQNCSGSPNSSVRVPLNSGSKSCYSGINQYLQTYYVSVDFKVLLPSPDYVIFVEGYNAEYCEGEPSYYQYFKSGYSDGLNTYYCKNGIPYIHSCPEGECRTTAVNSCAGATTTTTTPTPQNNNENNIDYLYNTLAKFQRDVNSIPLAFPRVNDIIFYHSSSTGSIENSFVESIDHLGVITTRGLFISWDNIIVSLPISNEADDGLYMFQEFYSSFKEFVQENSLRMTTLETYKLEFYEHHLFVMIDYHKKYLEFKKQSITIAPDLSLFSPEFKGSARRDLEREQANEMEIKVEESNGKVEVEEFKKRLEMERSNVYADFSNFLSMVFSHQQFRFLFKQVYEDHRFKNLLIKDSQDTPTNHISVSKAASEYIRSMSNDKANPWKNLFYLLTFYNFILYSKELQLIHPHYFVCRAQNAIKEATGRLHYLKSSGEGRNRELFIQYCLKRLIQSGKFTHTSIDLNRRFLKDMDLSSLTPQNQQELDPIVNTISYQNLEKSIYFGHLNLISNEEKMILRNNIVYNIFNGSIKLKEGLEILSKALGVADPDFHFPNQSRYSLEEIPINHLDLPDPPPPSRKPKPSSTTTIINQDENRIQYSDVSFTIDSEKTTDVDDSIGIVKDSNGDDIIVAHIADVTSLIKPNTIIDHYSYLKGSSLYFPNETHFMLPRNITHKLSLEPEQWNKCVTFKFKLSGTTGEITDYKIEISSVRGMKKTTYEKIDDYFENRSTRNLETEFTKPQQQMIDRLYDLMVTRKNYRTKNGMDIDLPDHQFEIDNKLVMLLPNKRKWSQIIVSEVMITCGWISSKFFQDNQIAGIYRNQSTPNFLHYSNFENELNQYHPIARNMFSLRCMSQASLSQQCLGHFSLGFDNYTWVSSPIRR